MRRFNAVVLLRVETTLPLDDIRLGLPWYLRRWFERLHGGTFRVIAVEVSEPRERPSRHSPDHYAHSHVEVRPESIGGHSGNR